VKLNDHDENDENVNDENDDIYKESILTGWFVKIAEGCQIILPNKYLRVPQMWQLV